jgi:uncharacterized protein YjbI with pentapeptide repeats
MGRTATRALSLRPIATLLNIFLLFGTATHAELINGNGRVIPGTEELTLFPGADLSGLNLFGLAAVDQQLSDASFEGTVLTGAEFARTNLTGANFEDAVVNSAYFDNLSPTQLYATANYKNQNLRAIQLFNPMVEPGAIWDFSGQDLDNAGLSGDFRGANFENANLVRTRFSGNYGLANWTNSNLRYARLGGEFPDTDFRGLNFQSALLVGNFPNSDFANANFTEATFRSGDFEQADFNGANINLAKLQGGSLSEEQVYSTANYRAGDLRGIEFERSFGDGIVGIAFDLSGWNLSNQNLSDVKFNLADLREANLREATLHRSRLGGANVTGADFENADMSFVQLGSEENFGGIVIIPTTSISESNFAGSRLLRGNLLGSEISDSSFT